MNYTLKSFNTWQITLPKKWRDKYDTNIFLAQEINEWLLVKPILNNESPSEIIYYEDKGWFWIYSEKGINPQDIISKIKKLKNR